MTTTGRDYVKLAQFVRARLILAAVDGQVIEYGELSPHAHLRWFSTRVLGEVYRECGERGEPDLTGLLVRRGNVPEPDEAAAVWDYWRDVRS